VSKFQPRPGQKEVLAYTGGLMGISAVPGSGKTRTLAELAALLVCQHIDAEQEVLIVTLVNSAVDNFKQQINIAIGQSGLLPGFGYRVRTLHGLAHDIVRERPGLVGLSEDFGIIDERQAGAVLQDAVETWLRSNPDAADPYLSPDVEGSRAEWVKRKQWPALVGDVAAAFIKRAKDRQLGPDLLLERLQQADAVTAGGLDSPSLPLAMMCAGIYRDYQGSLAYRGVVDFDDLIRLALEALKRDGEYLARLQQRWPYVLEDEAQDSSHVQEKILRLLTGGSGNWVRVGDPNQAIYETFTTADPELLRSFTKRPDVDRVALLQSGRSQQAIIDLANHLIDWTYHEHSSKFARQHAFTEQYIQPTDPGDPQPNPAVDRAAVRLRDRGLTPEEELRAVADSLAQWLPDHQDCTVAVLAPRNQRGFELIELLKQRGISHVELLRSTSITRQTAGALGNLLRCLADPTSARRLAQAFRVWRRDDREDEEAKELLEATLRRLAACSAVEAYLWPRADHDWLASVTPELDTGQLALLSDFRELARRWHRAASLPIDQLVLTLAGDLFTASAELALAHKLALLLRDISLAHPAYRLPELVEELAVIARNERRFLGYTSEDSGFEPPPGVVTVATVHKAKGLEWDRVYLMAVNNYNFPSGLAHDNYIAERWFVRDRLNLEAEALAQLDILAQGSGPISSTEDEATGQARREYITERLRLLYVGITRAKRDLIITWNTGRARDRLQPAAAFVALQEFWHGQDQEDTESHD
jgi:DNA helicase-2/ATP-dependent DNA helicase PcrA